MRELEQLPERSSSLLQGEKKSTVFTMNGVRFHHDALEGQKTGAFLDQRENYAAAAQYARGEALDVFCYHGGFALHLAQRCSKVTGVDSSRPALEVADRNAELNGREIEWIEANAFDLLRDYASAGQQYDTVVLDPPAFAKSKSNLDTALRGYKEPEDAAAGRDTGHLLVLLPCQPDRLPPSRYPGRSRYPPNCSPTREPDPSQGPPDPAGSPRECLLEVPNPVRILMKIGE